MRLRPGPRALASPRVSDWRATLSRRSSLALCLAAVACSTEPDRIGTSSAIVYGYVSRHGSPVPGARVYPVFFLNACGPSPATGALETTGPDGRWRQLIQLPFSEQTGCLLVRVLYDRDSGPDSVRVTTPLLIKDDSRPGPPDSTRVDVALPD